MVEGNIAHGGTVGNMGEAVEVKEGVKENFMDWYVRKLKNRSEEASG